MPQSPVIVWLRRDLRLHDNGALFEAGSRNGPVIPLFIWSPEEEAPWQPGAASRWWLHHSLENLNRDLGRHHSRLVIRTGKTLQVIRDVIKQTGATSVYWNRLYDPALVQRDTKIKAALKADGIDAQSFGGHLLFEPTVVTNKQDKPFQVFTPFWKHLLTRDDPPEPLGVPRLRQPVTWPASINPHDLQLLPAIDWAGGIRKAWQPGEKGAHEVLESFLAGASTDYDQTRNRPDISGTSRMSPYLHFGEITPRAIWHQTKRFIKDNIGSAATKSAWAFLREVGWREFSHHLLYHFPHTTHEPLRPEFAAFDWHPNEELIEAWRRGRTGYPIVDAGMRELWTTGWMHNRVRMIAASFLVKDLMIPWQNGAAWFWDTLVDADLANNTMGWQWTAGCGADAAPFFRIFNPITQGEKFDPDGVYTRRWVPELRAMPRKYLFKPWQAPTEILAKAGVTLGDTYPKPVVDHAEARIQALDAYGKIKKNG